MEVAYQDMVNALAEHFPRIGDQGFFWQADSKCLIGFFQVAFGLVSKARSHGHEAHQSFGNGIFGDFTETQVILVQFVYEIAMHKKRMPFLMPGRGRPGEAGAISFYNKELVVAFNEANGSSGFYKSAAPFQKLPLIGFLVAGQGDPEIKNISQKNKGFRALFQAFKHLKECGLIMVSYAHM